MSNDGILNGGRKTKLFNAMVWTIIASLATVSCSETVAPPKPVAEQNTSEFLPEATVREIMEAMMSPAAEAIWDSVAFIATREYSTQARPETEEDWQALRRQAVTMAEAANALLIPGRRIGSPGAPSDDPEHELSPDEMQAMMETDRAAWVGFAHAIHAQAMETIRIIDAKNADGLSDVGGTIDAACEGCHLQFWYPLQLTADQDEKTLAQPIVFYGHRMSSSFVSLLDATLR